MGNRREPRKALEVSVRIFGTDSGGRIFSEKVTTVDVSHNGAKVKGVKTDLKLDEIIGLTCGKNKVHFRVKWAGEAGSPSEGQIGLLNLTPEKPLWDFALPSGAMDTFSFATKNRRRCIRVKCSISVEIHPAEGQLVTWGKASDLSEGGCFVEMPIPLKVDAAVEIALWLGETKLRLQGEVVSSAPGFGIGVRFVNTSLQDRDILQQHLVSITQPGEISLPLAQESMKRHEIKQDAATQEWFCIKCLRRSDHMTQQDAERELSQFECIPPVHSEGKFC
jgi:hypothetical protein